MAASAVLISVEEYLRTIYRPDCGLLTVPGTPIQIEVAAIFAELQRLEDRAKPRP
jgi:hypothetical protein